jgi:transposase
MLYVAAAVERAMKIQQVIVRALSGAITWLQAADILGVDPHSVRRWRARYEAGGPVALYDRRLGRPSRRQAPAPEVQRILRLYRERFAGWNVRHFYRFARREPAVTLSYSFVRLALQEAGLVRKARARGRHAGGGSPRVLWRALAPGWQSACLAAASARGAADADHRRRRRDQAAALRAVVARRNHGRGLQRAACGLHHLAPPKRLGRPRLPTGSQD